MSYGWNSKVHLLSRIKKIKNYYTRVCVTALSVMTCKYLHRTCVQCTYATLLLIFSLSKRGDLVFILFVKNILTKHSFRIILKNILFEKILSDHSFRIFFGNILHNLSIAYGPWIGPWIDFTNLSLLFSFVP